MIEFRARDTRAFGVPEPERSWGPRYSKRMSGLSQAEFKAQYEGTWEPTTEPAVVGSLLPPGCVLGPRVLVCGGRDYTNRYRMWAVLHEMHGRVPMTVLIEGECPGKINADKIAKRWAEYNGIPVLPFPADWVGDGMGAGPRRNLKMLCEGRPDVVVAFPGGRGTRDMVQKAKFCGYQVVDLRYEKYGWVGTL